MPPPRAADAGSYVRRLIVTDGIFSMDGDIAPLPDLVTLAEQYACMLMVDDAHATGVLGPNGGGTGDHFGLAEKIDVAMGTFGKALGGFGAFVAGERSLREFLINCSRPFMFTTGLPPSVIAGAIAALEVVEDEPELRACLWDNANRLRQGIEQLGFAVREDLADGLGGQRRVQRHRVEPCAADVLVPVFCSSPGRATD